MDFSEYQFMKHPVHKIIKIVFSLVFLSVFAWVSGQLFFDDEIAAWIHSFDDDISQSAAAMDTLAVAYFDEAFTLEPTVALPEVHQRLINLYEPLVRPDSDLNIEGALAVSWGLVDDYTWEFNLRPGVLFHDGSKFDAEDVVASIGRAQNWPDSELKPLLSNVSDVVVVDDLTLRIITENPDPLLLQKLSAVFILPKEYAGIELPVPVGTGSYIYSDWIKDSVMTFMRFPDYWGDKAKFSAVYMIPMFDKSSRVSLLVDGAVDLLTTVPVDAADYIESEGFNLATVPSLEVAFLMFNTNSKSLADVMRRRAVSMALDVENFVSRLGRFVDPLSQYVSNGIFGYNPRISAHNFDLEAASMLARETGLEGEILQFHLPKELSILGEFVRVSMEEAGIPVLVSYMELSDYYDALYDGDADIYYIGFKADLGDAGDFFNAVTHTDGDFNFVKYSNERVDSLSDAAFVELDPIRRRGFLQELMKIVVEDEFIGVPIYEYETVYAFNNKIEFVPRIDGGVYFDEIIVK